MFYWFFRVIGRLGWRLLTGHYISGLENIPAKGGLVLCSNHVSYLDPSLIAMGMGIFNRKLNFMARDTLFKNLFFRLFIYALHAFPVKRGGADRDAWKDFQRRVDQGQAVVFFPEGTRSNDGVPGRANRGAGMLIHRCKNATVIPVRVYGVEKIMPKGKGLVGLFSTGVTFGKAVDLSAELAEDASKEVFQSISDKVMDSIVALEPHPALLGAGGIKDPKNKK